MFVSRTPQAEKKRTKYRERQRKRERERKTEKDRERMTPCKVGTLPMLGSVTATLERKKQALVRRRGTSVVWMARSRTLQPSKAAKAATAAGWSRHMQEMAYRAFTRQVWGFGGESGGGNPGSFYEGWGRYGRTPYEDGKTKEK